MPGLESVAHVIRILRIPVDVWTTMSEKIWFNE